MRKAVFLDRDGTINVDKGYVHTPEEFELIPGVVEGLRILQANGYLLIVVTNQSGIGRGYYSEQEYLEFQSYVDEELRKQGIRIDGWYYCPHVEEDNCLCRKPGIQLFEKAAADFDISWDESIVIGDKPRDLSICEAKGVRGFWISSDEDEAPCGNIICVSSIREAAYDYICNNGISKG